MYQVAACVHPAGIDVHEMEPRWLKLCSKSFPTPTHEVNSRRPLANRVLARIRVDSIH